MVECDSLENCCTRKGTQGSNPCPSAKKKRPERVLFFASRIGDENPLFDQTSERIMHTVRSTSVYVSECSLARVERSVTSYTCPSAKKKRPERVLFFASRIGDENPLFDQTSERIMHCLKDCY